MNLSGLSVRDLVDEYELRPEQDLIVIYDELDLPSGAIRIRQRGSSAGHNGMESVLGALGTEEIARVRLGIAPDRPVKDGARFVLSPFRKSQYKALDELLDAAADAAELMINEGVSTAMNRFNRKAKPEES